MITRSADGHVGEKDEINSASVYNRVFGSISADVADARSQFLIHPITSCLSRTRNDEIDIISVVVFVGADRTAGEDPAMHSPSMIVSEHFCDHGSSTIVHTRHFDVIHLVEINQHRNSQIVI